MRLRTTLKAEHSNPRGSQEREGGSRGGGRHGRCNSEKGGAEGGGGRGRHRVGMALREVDAWPNAREAFGGKSSGPGGKGGVGAARTAGLRHGSGHRTDQVGNRDHGFNKLSVQAGMQRYCGEDLPCDPPAQGRGQVSHHDRVLQEKSSLSRGEVGNEALAARRGSARIHSHGPTHTCRGACWAHHDGRITGHRSFDMCMYVVLRKCTDKDIATSKNRDRCTHIVPTELKVDHVHVLGAMCSC